MTITELATRIERRLADVHEEISRLQAADAALAATDVRRDDVALASEPQRPSRIVRPEPVGATRGRGHSRAVDRCRAKPAAVLALARELDAGLGNRL